MRVLGTDRQDRRIKETVLPPPLGLITAALLEWKSPLRGVSPLGPLAAAVPAATVGLPRGQRGEEEDRDEACPAHSGHSGSLSCSLNEKERLLLELCTSSLSSWAVGCPAC